MKWLSFLLNKQIASLYGTGVIAAIVYFIANLWGYYHSNGQFLTATSAALIVLMMSQFLYYDGRRFFQFFSDRKVRLLAASAVKLYVINVAFTVINLFLLVGLLVFLMGFSHLIVYQTFLIPNLEIAEPKIWLIVFGFYLMVLFLFLLVNSIWQGSSKLGSLVKLLLLGIVIWALLGFLGNIVFPELSAIGLLLVYLIFLVISLVGSVYLIGHYIEGKIR
ncbi:hypothetical protein ACYSNU_11735 [Enterococcus sp. LJL120]